MGYQLNVKAIQESFNITSGKVKHNPLVRSKWLPYTVNFDENKQNVFVEVVAEFVRLISKKGQVKSVTMEELLDQVLQNPNLKVEANHRSHLKELLQTLFFTEEGKLYLFHPKILYYLPSSKENSKMGNFLRDVLWNQTQFTGNDQHDEPTDAVTKLLFESFMPLETKVEKEDVLPYQQALPVISDLFTADYSWLTRHPDLFVLHVEKLMIFYYFFYVSQFALTGKAMFSTTGENISPVYFNLEWESISQTRTSYLQGWKKLEDAVGKLFTQINCLEMLNHTVDREQKAMTFQEIARRVMELDSVQKDQLIDQLQELIEVYRGVTLAENKWGLFVHEPHDSDPVLDKMRELYRTIDFQFHHSDRLARYRDYAKWFVHFSQKASLLKTRGRLGKTLSLNADYLLFLTKLILKDQPKIRLKTLFDEFELRGVLFDRDTQKAIVEYFERINILDKKSDSGDALYVKSFL